MVEQPSMHALAVDQASAAWTAAFAGWVSVGVNLAVVLAALGVPYVLWRLERERERRTNAAAVRTGQIALFEIEQLAEWLGRASKSHSRTIQDLQPTYRRTLAGAGHAIEVVLNRGLQDAAIMAFLAEALMLVRDAQAIFANLPPSTVPDGEGVEVLTEERLANLSDCIRKITELGDHIRSVQSDAEMLTAAADED